MSMNIVKKLLGNRIILAALLVAGSIVGGAWLQSRDLELVGNVWLATAVYMLGILVAGWIMMPLVEEKGWLWATAVILALTIIFPAAMLNVEQWATMQLQHLGMTANTLFLILMISITEQPKRYAHKKWFVTGFYVLIMLVLTFLLMSL